jgi:hypothetical protein
MRRRKARPTVVNTVLTPPAPPRRKRGRPRATYTVELTPAGGTSRVQAASLRAAILAYLRAAKSNSAPLQALVQQFGPGTQNALCKLRDVGWVQRAADPFQEG